MWNFLICIDRKMVSLITKNQVLPWVKGMASLVTGFWCTKMISLLQREGSSLSKEQDNEKERNYASAQRMKKMPDNFVRHVYELN